MWRQVRFCPRDHHHKLTLRRRHSVVRPELAAAYMFTAGLQKRNIQLRAYATPRQNRDTNISWRMGKGQLHTSRWTVHISTYCHTTIAQHIWDENYRPTASTTLSCRTGSPMGGISSTNCDMSSQTNGFHYTAD